MKTNTKTMTYREYYDKVYGCFLGKCIGGTAGGPAEGRKELLDFPLNEELLHQTLPNDDLDLQIMWLELIDEVGFDITARDMAREFYDKVPYGPGEYAFFKKNYARGIYPPISGSFNNPYYKNGMGCPIRSEIWGCLFPGARDLIRKYVEMDGSLDHERDSIDAEYFLAVLEGELFFTNDLRGAIESALADISPESKLGRVLRDTIKWYDEGLDWRVTRGLILRHYGHADCTNMYQNLGFIMISLLYGKGDFRETIRVGLACGYDTDCICATAASILGIIRGADKLLNEDGMTDTGLAVEVRTKRKNGSIADLAFDVCNAGISAGKAFESTVNIIDYPENYIPISTSCRIPAITVEAVYDGAPILKTDKRTSLGLAFKNNTDASVEVKIDITSPNEIEFTPSELSIKLNAGERFIQPCEASLKPEAKTLCQQNIFNVKMSGSFGTLTDSFGLVGCDVWYRFGPFLENIKDLTYLPPHEGYGAHFKLLADENGYDVTREYHLGGIADINHEFVSEAEPFVDIANDGRAECIPERVELGEDLFDTADIQEYDGAHIDYLLRKLISPDERDVEIAVGHTAPFKLWVNGKLIGMSDKTKWWTCENMHFSVKFKRGENTIILKCAQQSNHAEYSVIYRINANRWNQYADFTSVLLDRE
ncbi:MAG: ADP-ribosylglycohydrolase family protein [Clostridiales bacterium]|nr:ADP-ribosylglycohydrolase family protein [Clostridiales bacterium]